jgi:hypothetical protein
MASTRNTSPSRQALVRPERPRRSSRGRSVAARAVRTIAAGLLATASGPEAVADEPAATSGEPEPRTVIQAAGSRYDTPRLHRLFFGDEYRSLWALPAAFELLDLRHFAGGLTPVRRIGAGQSSGLALKGADGRAYTFRGTEKDATRGLPEDLRRTIAGEIAQDQVAAIHPGAPVVAARLLEAAGVLHVEPRLVVMPDDEALGEFRADFAGVLGTIQEFPRAAGEDQPGFAGATEITGGRELLDLLRATPDERADSRAFLRARLVDLLLGDWDRHLGQWRWAKLPGKAGWQPVPEDRDFALCRFEGLLLSLARNWNPRWVSFDEDYPGMLGLTWQAWPLDRELLSDLEKPAWDEIAADLQHRLTDDVIDAAVRRLPEEYQRVDGARLAHDLRRRRDQLGQAANRFYRHLSEEVRVAATDAPDVVEAVALPGGDLEVVVSRADATGAPVGEPWFRRRFRPRETREVRIDLRGGGDRFAARGRSGVRVHVLGGEGDDVLDDSGGGGTRLADWQGRNRVLRGPGTALDERPYTPPPLESEEPFIPPRDWGRQTFWLPWFAFTPELGVFLGAGVQLDRFAFRTHPYRSRQLIHVGYATGARGFRGHYHGELRRENAAVFYSLVARASQIEILRFFGFGNETPKEESTSFYEVKQTELSLAPLVNVPLASRLTLALGPTLQHFSMRRPQGTFIGQTRPYGSGSFGQLGALAELVLDTRDVPAAAVRGTFVRAGGTFHPDAWDAEHAYGDVHLEASTHLTGSLVLRPTLALRLGAKRVFGTYPFQSAAFLGGDSSLRGFSSQRFAGDASVHGSAELRLSFGRFHLVLPGEWGAFALTDAGRVWLEGEDSDRWHTSAGGGLWFAYLKRANTVTLAVARSAEGTSLYIGMGFPF